MQEKEVVRIMLDYLQGAIWISDQETGTPLTGIDIVDNDPIIRELNYKCSEMYSGYYEFDSHDMACWFDEEQEKKDKHLMLSMLEQLIARLEEINDGSYEIDDRETERVRNL